ncbi:MAG TPA: aminotransferase class I/II-fold pyridoxal phosphate-dependent enzyme, partial [Anaeromyxobacteraceae bacterium]|nr:aminotransferase class I/II-fold pyridoxal phosphate-dependent enzyme [Anaeromyxobacteraceae bacterium]
SLGGFVVGDRALVDYLVNRARPLIFSTGLPPSAVAAALAALRAAEAEPWRRERVLALAARARAALAAAGYEVLPGKTPIVPIVVGDERLASALSEACLERGVFVPAIRTPSVPAGRARLRMTLCADHTDGQLEQALAVLCEARERLSP